MKQDKEAHLPNHDKASKSFGLWLEFLQCQDLQLVSEIVIVGSKFFDCWMSTRALKHCDGHFFTTF